MTKKGLITISIDTTKAGARKGELHRMHKSVELFLDPDVVEFIPNAEQKRIENPEKQKVTYIIVGNIE